LARLQNHCAERPLILAEIGLDSRRHGEAKQASALRRQISAGFACGCAGLFVFSWTDEWSRGGYDIGDWDFGLTTRGRRPKPALSVLRRTYAEVPFDDDQALFNVLAPAVVEKHVTAGFTYSPSQNSEITVAYMHAFRNSVDNTYTGTGNFDGFSYGAKNDMYQNSIEASYAWKF